MFLVSCKDVHSRYCLLWKSRYYYSNDRSKIFMGTNCRKTFVGSDPAKIPTYVLRADISMIGLGLGLVCSLLDKDRSMRVKATPLDPFPTISLLDTAVNPQFIVLSEFKLNIG